MFIESIQYSKPGDILQHVIIVINTEEKNLLSVSRENNNIKLISPSRENNNIKLMSNSPNPHNKSWLEIMEMV